ncbi:hypothetical protein LINPERPRIM_LOCUS18408 [Linum perenne]
MGGVNRPYLPRGELLR